MRLRFQKAYEYQSTIEANLDSICVSPRLHRLDLLRFVHHPKLQRLDFPPCEILDVSSMGHAFQILRRLSLKLIAEHGTPGSSSDLGSRFRRAEKPTKQGLSTELSDQVRKFCNKAAHVYEELGPSAVAYFILRTVETIRKEAELAEAQAFCVQKKDEMVCQLRHAFDQEGLTQIPDVLSLRS